MAKKLSFSDLDEKLTKISPLGSVVTKNAFSKIDEWIPTGNYMLNAQISGSLFGGIPNCRSVCIAGDSGTGKTFLTLNMCREAQMLGYDIIYCDSESAVDQDVFEKFGLDPNRVRYQPVTTIQEFTIFINNLLKMLDDARKAKQELPKVFLVLDSLGNLASKKEKDDAVSGNTVRDMTKQQVIRSMFRTTTVDLAANKIPFVITNHTYQGIGMFAKKEISGGGGVAFNPSIIMMLGKAQLKEENAESKAAEMKTTGIVVTSRPRKNRFAKPIPVRFHISFFKGMNKYTGLEKYISWDSCGIERGNILSQKEFDKLKDSDKEAYDLDRFFFTHERPIMEKNDEGVEVETGEMEKVPMYFWPKPTARSIVVRHLGKKLPVANLFTSEVITDEILHQIDEKAIKPLFMLPDIHSLEDLAEIAEDLEVVED
jgi:RecA/RadA recombinase